MSITRNILGRYEGFTLVSYTDGEGAADDVRIEHVESATCSRWLPHHLADELEHDPPLMIYFECDDELTAVDGYDDPAFEHHREQHAAEDSMEGGAF